MPIYMYECPHCGKLFDRLVLHPSEADLKAAECPGCGKRALRTYLGSRFSAPSASRSSELLEDEEPYRRMHYYEKQKDWESAAKAAEGVSEFARKKFLQKAESKEK